MEDMVDEFHGALNSPEAAINSPKEMRVDTSTTESCDFNKLSVYTTTSI